MLPIIDIQSKVEELEEVNQSLRNRDKMKDDAIAQLSDQLMALTARMQEIAPIYIWSF
jgi:predicted RNase H-like nuclease (RuvC/YqgF family)